jgi:hypothetical protein
VFKVESSNSSDQTNFQPAPGFQVSGESLAAGGFGLSGGEDALSAL